MVSIPLIVVGLLFALGVLVVAAGAAGRLPDLSELSSGGGQQEFGYPAASLALGLVGFIAMFLFTGWIVVGVYGAIGGLLLPTLVMAKRRRREEIARIEAIASWIESVRDTMAASAGMQQALQVSARVAPAPIRDEVRAMASRLQHQSTNEVLRRFAGDLKHPLSDMVVASLILASTRHAGSLRTVLAGTAKTARETAAMWREVEASRARIFAQARMAGWVTALMMGFMVAANRELLAVYDTFTGQVVLTVILGIFVAANYAMYRIAKPPAARRVFDDIERWSDIEGRVLQ